MIGKIKVEDMACYSEVVSVLGVVAAKRELFKVVNSKDTPWILSERPLSSGFSWKDTPQGFEFWVDVNYKLQFIGGV